MSEAELSVGRTAKQVKVRDLRAKLAAYLDEVSHGTSIEVVSRGQVVAELRPPAARPKRASTRGLLRGQIGMAPDFAQTPEDLIDVMEGATF